MLYLKDCLKQRLTSSSICRSVTYIFGSSDFASYLEGYLMEKYCTWDNASVWHKDWRLEIYVSQWPIFHGPLNLPFIIVIDKLFVYIKKWHRLWVFVPLQALALVLHWMVALWYFSTTSRANLLFVNAPVNTFAPTIICAMHKNTKIIFFYNLSHVI